MSVIYLRFNGIESRGFLKKNMFRTFLILLLLSAGTVASPNILIVSHFYGNASYLDYSISNHRAYAEKHGYAYWFSDAIISDEFSDPQTEDPLRKNGVYWQKIAAVRLHKLYEWIVWIDADAIFTNFEEPLEKTIQRYADNGTQLIISHDQPAHDWLMALLGKNCVNAGVFFVHNGEWSRKFFDNLALLYPLYKDVDAPEQSALSDLLYGYVVFENGCPLPRKLEEVRSRECKQLRYPEVKVVDMHAINARHEILHCPSQSLWRAGDPIAHFMGDPFKTYKMRAMLECIKDQNNFRNCESDIVSSIYANLWAAVSLIAKKLAG